MKPKYILISEDVENKGRVILTKEELSNLIDDVYNQGFEDGKAYRYYHEPSIIPHWKSSTSPSIIPSYRDQWRINECDCDKVVYNTQTSTSTTMNK